MADFSDYPAPEIVRPAETGTVMAEGRAGGTGARFNIGEVTATRCVVRVDGRLGFSYALGRDRAKAELAATLDALLQNPERQEALLTKIITPLAQEEKEARELASRKAAATKVDFFTLIRGDE
ncbi:alpha-D-ribose 1-methylphosphonate 5-triphosphate synthase subunit PhnG [Rhizomicrobium palustre]|uniref:Alpha-D-ribose 1-methylphosphonate 5-triphosphate synthase subunit PhnG n=2 Tax=Rhizomicrobium palustre TaxID=189966 RepID=A0A846N242_9PROT|nr:alpha-D-ribose 1-methylphosphonate 5-triphosphate synthase subunit PhnG [Rhizomicrobium palustre]